VAAAALALAAPALAGGGQEAMLARALKGALTRTYKGYAFTRVSCWIPSPTSTRARCTARFVHAAQSLKGVFGIAVTIDRSTGGVRWQATSATCADLASGKKVAC